MKTHTLIQGSAEWHAYRASVWNASDAPAMMGCSPYKTRSELLQELAIQLGKEHSDYVQERVLDKGHEFEALTRPLAEQIIGEELAPVVGSSDTVIGGRALSASFDGIDFMETVAFEHKSLNQQLRECMEGLDESDRLPLHYRVQMEQQLMVSGAMRILFMASKWNGADLVEERHCWYYSDAKLREQILAGWAQLAEDLAKWQPQAVEVKPTGRAPDQLPALHVEVSGQVTASNLSEFKDTALAAIHSVNRNLVTDQDFADAEKAVKWCSDVEDRLAAAKQHALSQTATIDELFRTMDDISAEAKRVRLDLDKLVKARKEAIRVEIVTENQRALAEHVDSLNKAFPRAWVAMPAAAFGEAIKGKRTLSSIREACSVVLAQAKIVANQAAERFKANRAALVVEGRDWIDLFPDFATVGNKPAEDFDAVLQLRIGKHQEAERQAEAARQRAAEQAQAAIQQAATPAVQPPAPTPAAQVAAPAPTVSQMVPVAVPKPAANEAATVKLGEICGHIGSGFSMTAVFVEQVLGVPPAKVDKAARLYTPTDERRIYAALRDHLNGLMMQQAA
tara:strand:+ start:1766 stop:3460 length:1695 start_codon:yes stop_codon:yes gene_type:complete